MGKIRNIAAKLNAFDFNRALDLILMDLKPVITGMNKEQLSIGQDADGGTLEAYASPEYAVLKVEHFDSQAPLGIPNLKLSGDFYDGFTIILDSTKITITSTDIKALTLEGKYGDIFGLQQNKLEELALRYVLPRLATVIKQLFKG
jgi:hypothetical protein